MIFYRCLASVFVLFALVAFGCNSRVNPNTPAKISGEVTYKGQPVRGGTVTFHSDTAPYTLPISSEGTYSGSDLPVGQMVVTVETESVSGGKKQDYGGKKGMGSPSPDSYKGGGGTARTEVYTKIPARYSNKNRTDLKVTVEPGKQVKNFDLTD